MLIFCWKNSSFMLLTNNTTANSVLIKHLLQPQYKLNPNCFTQNYWITHVIKCMYTHWCCQLLHKKFSQISFFRFRWFSFQWNIIKLSSKNSVWKTLWYGKYLKMFLKICYTFRKRYSWSIDRDWTITWSLTNISNNMHKNFLIKGTTDKHMQDEDVFCFTNLEKDLQWKGCTVIICTEVDYRRECSRQVSMLLK
jgi:hypothetical protein